MTALQHGDGGQSPAKFRLDKAHGKWLGVCAGIANRTGIDPLWVRVAFVIGTLAGLGGLLLIYLGIALIAD